MESGEVRERLAAQMPQEEKVRRADYVIDNSGSRADTVSQVNDLLFDLFPSGLPDPLRPAALPAGGTAIS